MKETNKAYQKKVILVSSAVIFALMLIIAMIANLIQLSVKKKRIAGLEAEITYYKEQIALNNGDIEYRKTPEYIENFARDHLEMKKTEEEALKPR